MGREGASEQRCDYSKSRGKNWFNGSDQWRRCALLTNIGVDREGTKGGEISIPNIRVDEKGPMLVCMVADEFCMGSKEGWVPNPCGE